MAACVGSQYVIAGNGVAEAQFIERLIVNTLRLALHHFSILPLSVEKSPLSFGHGILLNSNIRCGCSNLIAWNHPPDVQALHPIDWQQRIGSHAPNVDSVEISGQDWIKTGTGCSWDSWDFE